MPHTDLSNFLGIRTKGPPNRRELIPYRASTAQNLQFRQKFTSARRGAPDLGAIQRLTVFDAAQRHVVAKEVTLTQRQTLKERQFSTTAIPQERAPRQLTPPFRRFSAAALGGANTEFKIVPVPSPRTMISLKNTRSMNPGMLARLARHEISHQVNREPANIQHAKIVLAGGVKNALPGRHSASDDREAPAPTGSEFFEAFERLSRLTPREPRVSPPAPGPTPEPPTPAPAPRPAENPPPRRDEPSQPNLRNLLGMNI